MDIETILRHALTACFYLGVVASLLSAWVAIVDYKRTDQWFRLIGIPAHIALACACGFILANTGTDPLFSRNTNWLGMQVSIMVWAVFKTAFALIHTITFIGVEENPCASLDGDQ